MVEQIRITHGVHRPAEPALDLAARTSALLTACPPGAVVSGLHAAQLHRLWLPPAFLVDRPAEVILHGAVQRPCSYAGTRRREVRGRRRQLDGRDVAAVDGIPVTSLARTWFELAGRLDLPALVAAGDSALRAGLDPTELDELLARCRRTPGVTAARRARLLLDGRSRSRPESHMRVAIVTAGLPVPEVNRSVHDDDGQWLFEPDLSYDDVRLAMEYVGADHAEVRRMRRDMTRTVDSYLRGAWQVVEFGPAEVFGRPDQLASMVGLLRRERGVVRGRPSA